MISKKRRLVSFDWAIKRLLRSKANFVILEGFLSELLKDDIKILSILESESNKNHPGQKANRLDLKVVNAKNEIVIIEIQYEREYDYFQRMLFAASTAICEHLPEGMAYSEIAKVISVNILYFNLGHGKDYIYHGQTSFVGLNFQDELALSSQQQKLFRQASPSEIFPEYYLIKVNNFNDVAKNTLDEWIYFLKNEEIKPGFKAKGIQKAKDRLDILKLSEADRMAYNRHSYDLHYMASMALYSDYGMARQEGIEQNQTEVARKMLAKGMPLSLIGEITGLSIEQIEKLAVDTPRVCEPAAPYDSPARARKPRHRKS